MPNNIDDHTNQHQAVITIAEDFDIGSVNLPQSKHNRTTLFGRCILVFSILLSLSSLISVVISIAVIPYYNSLLSTMIIVFETIPVGYFLHYLLKHRLYPTFTMYTTNLLWLSTIPVLQELNDQKISPGTQPDVVDKDRQNMQIQSVAEVDVRVFTDDKNIDSSDHSSDASLHIPGFEDRLNYHLDHSSPQQCLNDSFNEGNYNTMKASISRENSKRKVNECKYDYLLPHILGKPYGRQLTHNSNFVSALCLATMLWTVLIAWQLTHIVSAVIMSAIRIPFQAIWSVVGYLLFYTSAWSIDGLWQPWVFFWTGNSMDFKVAGVSDMERHQMSTVIRLVVSTFPVLIVQVVNIGLFLTTTSTFSRFTFVPCAVTLINITMQPLFCKAIQSERRKEFENDNKTRKPMRLTLGKRIVAPMTLEIIRPSTETIVRATKSIQGWSGYLRYHTILRKKRASQCDRCFDLLTHISELYPNMREALSSANINGSNDLSSLSALQRNTIILALPKGPLRDQVAILLQNLSVKDNLNQVLEENEDILSSKELASIERDVLVNAIPSILISNDSPQNKLSIPMDISEHVFSLCTEVENRIDEYIDDAESKDDDTLLSHLKSFRSSSQFSKLGSTISEISVASSNSFIFPEQDINEKRLLECQRVWKMIDVLRDTNTDLMSILRDANIDSSIHLYEGITHGLKHAIIYSIPNGPIRHYLRIGLANIMKHDEHHAHENSPSIKTIISDLLDDTLVDNSFSKLIEGGNSTRELDSNNQRPPKENSRFSSFVSEASTESIISYHNDINVLDRKRSKECQCCWDMIKQLSDDYADLNKVLIEQNIHTPEDLSTMSRFARNCILDSIPSGLLRNQMRTIMSNITGFDLTPTSPLKPSFQSIDSPNRQFISRQSLTQYHSEDNDIQLVTVNESNSSHDDNASSAGSFEWSFEGSRLSLQSDQPIQNDMISFNLDTLSSSNDDQYEESYGYGFVNKEPIHPSNIVLESIRSDQTIEEFASPNTNISAMWTGTDRNCSIMTSPDYHQSLLINTTINESSDGYSIAPTECSASPNHKLIVIDTDMIKKDYIRLGSPRSPRSPVWGAKSPGRERNLSSYGYLSP